MSNAIRGLAGDWHGNTKWAITSISHFADAGVTRVYHLGDFGIWPGQRGDIYLRTVEVYCRSTGIELWVTPGNHEDWSRIASTPIGRDGLQWVTDHIALIPRGHRWEDGGRTFVSLGGAPSIDFPVRVEGVTWWKEEMITEAEARAVAEAGYADVMLAHDSPDNGAPAVQAIIETPAEKSFWSDAGLAYAREGRKLMNIAFDGVRPALFIHGHYHVYSQGRRDGTLFVALAADGIHGNTALLDLETLQVTI